jgi:hypothetical protein
MSVLFRTLPNRKKVRKMIQFELLPTLDIMVDLYEKPRDRTRFQAYLKLLQGDTKGDLAMPISGFNPMAKPHLLEKLTELKAIQAETIIKKTLFDLNRPFKTAKKTPVFKVALNVSDDLAGGWTNRFTSDYDNKFKINALVKRQFCTPMFWASEPYSETLVQQRTLESAFRTIYWLNHSKPCTLKEHVEQEKWVAHQSRLPFYRKWEPIFAKPDLFTKYCESDSYHIIFNFLYGDKASESLEFPIYTV